ncbi:FMRFamide receptor-like [Mya arenaria]|uniref:FMRFamide receptor-like n=1 Tax=Mya arenaria TaxID=6604 RepID=UPI0022E697CE|nr:FMRFamide receptor-like [Mya arenaria]
MVRWWIIYVFDIDVRLFGDVGCRLHWFFIFASTELSSWLLVAVTCERIISTMWPHKVRVLCTRRSAFYVILSLVVTIYGGTSHILFGMHLGSVMVEEHGFNNHTQFPNSTSIVKAFLNNHSYADFFNFIYPWVDLLMYFLIPAVILVIGDIIIIRKIIESRTLRKLMLHIDSSARKLHDKSASVTMMLLTVNAVFVLCTTPISIFLIGMPYWVDSAQGFTSVQAIGWAIVNLLMYLNHAINFILYFLSGTKFRQKVMDMFYRKKIQRAQSLSLSQRESNSDGCSPHLMAASFSQCRKDSQRSSYSTKRLCNAEQSSCNDSILKKFGHKIYVPTDTISLTVNSNTGSASINPLVDSVKLYKRADRAKQIATGRLNVAFQPDAKGRAAKEQEVTVTTHVQLRDNNFNIDNEYDLINTEDIVTHI